MEHRAFNDNQPSQSFAARLWQHFIRLVLWWQELKCERCHYYLVTHSSNYRENYTRLWAKPRGDNLYRGRDISPLDPSLPDQRSIEADLPPMSWPHNRP